VLIGLLAAVPGGAGTAPCPAPPVPSLAVRELSLNAATVKSGDRTGLGFVVGWKKGEAWLAVPAHVVFGKGVLPTPREIQQARGGLAVRLFREDRPRRLCDEGPSPPQGLADLAFVCVEWTGRPFFNEGVLARRIRAGDGLTLIDVGTGQEFHGSVAAAPAASGDPFDETGGDGTAGGFEKDESALGVAGQSGAVTASPGGVVGLYLGHDAGYRFLSMPAIRAAAEVALVPWQLTSSEYYDCTETRSVCYTAETEVVAASVTLKNVFAPGSFTLQAGRCAPLPEGRYEIAAPPSGPSCEPKVVSVYAAKEDLRLGLRCAIVLMGTWRAEDGDELTCIETRMGNAQCNGLGHRGWGVFAGSINVKGSGFSLLGSFYDAAGNPKEATGSLRWSEGALIGEIRLQLEPPQPLKLQRVEVR
jgi:hypothetical protein